MLSVAVDGPADPADFRLAVRELADRYDQLEQHAIDSLRFFERKGRVARRVRARRELSPEFLREIAGRHREHRRAGRPPTKALAREEGVSPSTVKHWLRRAAELET